MEEDIVASLTRQVKEEVIANYVMERRLIELQIEHLHQQAEETRTRAWIAGKRLTRLSFLMIRPEMRDRLKALLKLSNGNFWTACLDEKFQRSMRLLRVRALTRKGKFRKLIMESYEHLSGWMKKYRVAYEDISDECRAVNSNIEAFQRNFDLLSILNFLRTLDLQGLERKRILGDNFTAIEMAELDKSLYIRPISLEKLAVPPPLDIPPIRQVEQGLAALSDEIFRKYEKEVKAILR